MIAYQIAKASLIYDVAEIIVLKEKEENEQVVAGPTSEGEKIEVGSSGGKKVVFGDDDDEGTSSSPIVSTTTSTTESKDDAIVNDEIDDALLLASLLQFFITPPYLIKTMFLPRLNPKFSSILPKFKYAFKLPKIPNLPFMQNNNVHEHYKEGIIIPRATPKIKSKISSKLVPSPHKVTVSKYVNIGESEAMQLEIARELPVYSRVTVDVRNKTIVSAKQAYGVNGHKLSFGYHVRMVNDVQFNKVFTGSPVADGYNQTIFVNCDDYFDKWDETVKDVPLLKEKSDVDNVLMILGNYGTIQRNFLHDEAKDTIFEGLDSVLKLFDYRLDIPKGCKIEDAILIALTKLQ